LTSSGVHDSDAGELENALHVTGLLRPARASAVRSCADGVRAVSR
jgi:hypothetical protein